MKRSYIHLINAALIQCLLFVSLGHSATLNTGTDWTNTTKNLYTTGTVTALKGVITNTITNVEGFNSGYFTPGVIYRTLGYYNPEDGGQAEYLIVGGNSADGYINHSVNGGTYTAELQYSGELNIRQAGVHPSRTAAQNTSALQAAVNYNDVSINRVL